MSEEIKIRPYKKEDRDVLRDICKETAWESYKKDPKKLECVPIMFLDYFIEQEPFHVYVAVDQNDKPVGYIECTSDYSFFVKKMNKVYMKRIKETRKQELGFCRRYLFALFFIRKYPSHMHMNITAAYQRQGIGRRLIDTICEALKSEGFKSLAICANEKGSGSYHFYTKCGFKEVFSYGHKIVSLARTL